MSIGKAENTEKDEPADRGKTHGSGRKGETSPAETGPSSVSSGGEEGNGGSRSKS